MGIVWLNSQQVTGKRISDSRFVVENGILNLFPLVILTANQVLRTI